MKSFKTLREFYNYIPNCIICGKLMNVSMMGSVINTPSITKKSNSFSTYQAINLKMILKDDVCRSKHPKYSMVINVNNNQIIDGKDIIGNFLKYTTNLIKNCSTCSFKINCHFTNTNCNYFSETCLMSQELKYTLSGGKSINIYVSNVGASIIVDKKYLPSSKYFDLSQFKNLDQLNKRISTIITFS